MSDSGNGPIYYGTIEEEFPPAYVNFYELLYGDTIDKIETLRPADIDVYRAAAKKFAAMHIITEEDCPRPITNCYTAWPWNTRAIRSHYDETPEGIHVRQRYRGLNKTISMLQTVIKSINLVVKP